MIDGYMEAHFQIYRARGEAKKYPCAMCAGDAHDWALRPGAKVVEGVRYRYRNGEKWPVAASWSVDPYDYEPMCRKCHSKMDLGIEDADHWKKKAAEYNNRGNAKRRAKRAEARRALPENPTHCECGRDARYKSGECHACYQRRWKQARKAS